MKDPPISEPVDVLREVPHLHPVDHPHTTASFPMPLPAYVPTIQQVEEMHRQAEEHERRRSEEELWKAACLSALTGINMGLANKDALDKAIAAADDVLAEYKKRFRVPRQETAKLIALRGGQSDPDPTP